MSLPTTTIGGIEISRLVCGSNSFFGFSHISAARDKWIRRVMTDDVIVEIMARGAELGINAFISGPVERVPDILAEVKKRTGVHIYWFCTPGGPSPRELEDGIRKTKDLGAEFCMPHTCWTEMFLDVANQEIRGLHEACELIRKLDMIPGLSNHRPESLVCYDKQGYDLATITLPFNAQGFLCSVETDWTARLIQRCPLPILAIKPLGAGRIQPPTGFCYVYNHIKPVDTVAVGVLSPEEIEEDVELALQYASGAAAETDLTMSRSKAALAYGHD
ncbi:MAG: hypothetical protein ACODAJ_15370 [Planctomycetota bacterium]